MGFTLCLMGYSIFGFNNTIKILNRSGDIILDCHITKDFVFDTPIVAGTLIRIYEEKSDLRVVKIVKGVIEDDDDCTQLFKVAL